MTRARSPGLTVIYWRDIPAQVIASTGHDVHRVELDDRFQQAIDRAAMHTGRIGTEEYLEDWRRDSQPLNGDPREAAVAAAAEVEERYSIEALNDLVANGGFEEQ
ncbi:MAG: virulence factor [Acidimicrobiia bacterium]